MKNKRLKKILSEASKYHRGCRNISIYEVYKRELAKLDLPPREYEAAIRELAAVLGVLFLI